MQGDKTDRVEVHIHEGGQFNLALDNAKINAVQNVDTGIILKKRLTSNPIENICFVGRENEKRKVKEYISAKHKVVLNGVGGIGKTALAKQIYFELENKYDYVAWINYNNDWIESVLTCIFLSGFHFDRKLSKIE